MSNLFSTAAVMASAILACSPSSARDQERKVISQQSPPTSNVVSEKRSQELATQGLVRVRRVGSLVVAARAEQVGRKPQEDARAISHEVPNVPGTVKHSIGIEPDLAPPRFVDELLAGSTKADPDAWCVAHSEAYRVELQNEELHIAALSPSGDKEQVPLTAFWTAEALPSLDSYILRDEEADRFLMVAIHNRLDAELRSRSMSSLLVAVSDDADPLGEWYSVSVRAWSDVEGRPHVGSLANIVFGDDSIAVAVRLQGSRAGDEGLRIWEIERGLVRGGLYTGAGATARVFGY